MSSEAQIAANIENAKLSTGPQTAEGKAVSSRNGISQGLFTARDFVRPEAEPEYAEFTQQLNCELAPIGLLETNLVHEIRRAMWRLRRCGEVESNLVIRLATGKGYVHDPMDGFLPEAEKSQNSVDRARSQAHRLLHKCTAELRKLQNERRTREEDLKFSTPSPKPQAMTMRTQSPEPQHSLQVVEMKKQTPRMADSVPDRRTEDLDNMPIRA